MRQAVVAVLADVDAGKSTLAEAMLQQVGAVREAGRVDAGTSHFDVGEDERARGITIRSKQACLDVGGVRIMFVDTPGHADFAAEAARPLFVADLVVLVVAANDGVTGRTRALWSLAERAGVPLVVFVNKADFPTADVEGVVGQIRRELSGAVVSFSGDVSSGAKTDAVGDANGGSVGGASADVVGGVSEFAAEGASEDAAGGAVDADDEGLEQAALSDERALEEYLESGTLSRETVTRLFSERKLFPLFIGSALRGDGVRGLLEGVADLVIEQDWPAEFAARVYAQGRGARGERVTYLKVTGGELLPRMAVARADGAPAGKVAELREYVGAKFAAVSVVPAGRVCGVTGLAGIVPGDALGAETARMSFVPEAVSEHEVVTEGKDHEAFEALRQMAEEDPALMPRWDERSHRAQLRLMGEVQLEVVQAELSRAHGISASFGPGAILYKETIEVPARGVGHFEPLRHYAEVHLLLEPLPRGSGVEFGTVASEDALDRNWQRLILTNAAEREHPGVLVGAPLTDVRITLLAGRAHAKHTEGGDFRQATYRAIRQALMRAKCVLLEPWLQFEVAVPADKIGRVLSDLQAMAADFGAPEQVGDRCRVLGRVPASEAQGWPTKVAAYTAGEGSATLSGAGYDVCHNADEVIADKGYDPLTDADNPVGSVFCSHGAGHHVPWDEVPAMAHVDADVAPKRSFVRADAAFYVSGTGPLA